MGGLLVVSIAAPLAVAYLPEAAIIAKGAGTTVSRQKLANSARSRVRLVRSDPFSEEIYLLPKSRKG